MPEEPGNSQPNDQIDASTLAASGDRAGKLHWGVGAIGEEKFREPSLRDLASRGELFSRAHVVALLVAIVMISGIAYLDTATTNYVVVTPGSVDDLRGQIVLEGSDLPPTFEHQGEIALVTVRTGKASFMDHFYATFRDDIDLLPAEQTRRPGESEGDERRRDEQLMSNSQEIAEFVALRHLGYAVSFEGDGALVEDVSSGTAAVGKIMPGDIIKAIDGRPILVSTEIREALHSKQIGDEVTLSIERKGENLQLVIPLSVSTDGEQRPVIGVLVRTLNPRVRTPFEVQFRTEDIGGPSAGLAFALEIIDTLTPGDMTHGRKVVATGAIAPSGAVSPVGGVFQKAIAASRSGADYFLVPRDNFREIGAMLGPTRVIPVDTVDDAVAFLAEVERIERPDSLPGGARPPDAHQLTPTAAP